MTETVISPHADPELAQRLAASAMATSTVKQAPKEPAAPPPPDTDVVLPGGYYDVLTGVTVCEAEVRELTGADEEALAKAKSNAKFYDTVLQRGVVRVGDKKADATLLDGLLSGDRDHLMIAVRVATYGPEVELEGIVCPTCAAKQDVTLDLTQDVPSKPLEDRTFEVALRRGTAVVTLPTGTTQRKLLEAADKTAAELNTILLSQCVQTLNGQPVLGAASVREGLGAGDRAKIIDELGKRIPGPRLGEVSKACRQCSEEIELALTQPAIFRL